MGVGLIEGLYQHLVNILLTLLVAQAVSGGLKGLQNGATGDLTCRITTHAISYSEKIGLTHQQSILVIFPDQAHMGPTDYLHYFFSCSLANLARS